MRRFLLLYRGPPAPPDATHEGWPEWFAPGSNGTGLGEVT
jgi:hypothetical protein